MSPPRLRRDPPQEGGIKRNAMFPRSHQLSKQIAFLAFGPFLHTLAFPPYGWTSLGWLALAPLFVFLRNTASQSLWYAFLGGVVYGTGWCVGVGDWLFSTVIMHFHLPFPVDILFVIGNYVVFAGLATGLATTLSSLFMRTGNPLLCWCGIPAVWVCGEFVRSDLTFGSSWGILGYSQFQHLSLIQIADLSGVYGLSFLMAFSSYLVAESVDAFRVSDSSFGSLPSLPWPGLGLFVTMLGATWLYGTSRLQDYPPLSAAGNKQAAAVLEIALVQGHVPDVQRWKRVYFTRSLLKYVSVSQREMQGTAPDLIVWPEFAINFYLDQEPVLRAQLGRFTQHSNAPLLLGGPRMETVTTGSQTESHTYNSAYLLAPGGKIVDWYDKIYLIPFAEALPFNVPVDTKGIFSGHEEAPSLFTHGRRSTIFPLLSSQFGVLICYEAIFPSLSRHLVNNGAEFLVNISNDTWLNDDPGAIAQHFTFSAFRAVENKRFLVRPATAGVSGFVDPVGRPSQLSTEKDRVVWGKIAPHHERTVYTRYGDWFAWTCMSFVLVALGVPLTTRRQARAGSEAR